MATEMKGRILRIGKDKGVTREGNMHSPLDYDKVSLPLGVQFSKYHSPHFKEHQHLVLQNNTITLFTCQKASQRRNVGTES